MVMGGENVGAVLRGVDDLVLLNLPMPSSPPPLNHCIVEMKKVGICGSDVHYWKHGRIGPFELKKPMIIGHESAGVIVEVGAGVTHLKPGDHVALEPGVPCKSCRPCRTGQYNLCPDIHFFSTPPYDGSLCNYITHPSDYCFKLPANVSLEEGALCEPLSVGVYACQRGEVAPGSSVAVFGAGPIGLVSLLSAFAFGAKAVVITDISVERLAFAATLGARVLNVMGKSEQEIVRAITALNGGEMVDVSIECSGSEKALRPAILCTASGGCVTLVGMGAPDVSVPIMDAAVRQVDLRGIFRYRNTYPTCINLLACGKINVKPLITHRYDWKTHLIEGFETARTGRDGAIKVIFTL